MNHTALTHSSAVSHTKKLAKRWPLVLGIGIGLLTASSSQPSGTTTYFLPVLALIYLVFGAARGHLRKPGMLSLQLVGLLVFTLFAVAALLVDPGLGKYVVAGGWFAHALWDVYHLRKDVVVPKWYAEACIAIDLLVAASLLAV
jgi:hypothetical protein